MVRVTPGFTVSPNQELTHAAREGLWLEQTPGSGYKLYIVILLGESQKRQNAHRVMTNAIASEFVCRCSCCGY